ncbi:MAG: (2Fe-2S)-binding protein [Comamonas sp.]
MSLCPDPDLDSGVRDAPASPDPAIRLAVNGRPCTVAAAGATPLLYVLRNDLALNGPKYGCGLGECGACTVLIDGVAARSCVIPVRGAAGREVTTLEGLGGPACPGPTQQAFIACQAAQCGYCLNGMIMTTEALLRRNPRPTEHEIRQELRHNMCRCGTHVEILQAARLAAERRAALGSESESGTPGAPA